MTVLQSQTKERGETSINHPTSMFQLVGNHCKKTGPLCFGRPLLLRLLGDEVRHGAHGVVPGAVAGVGRRLRPGPKGEESWDPSGRLPGNTEASFFLGESLSSIQKPKEVPVSSVDVYLRYLSCQLLRLLQSAVSYNKGLYINSVGLQGSCRVVNGI